MRRQLRGEGTPSFRREPHTDGDERAEQPARTSQCRTVVLIRDQTNQHAKLVLTSHGCKVRETVVVGRLKGVGSDRSLAPL